MNNFIKIHKPDIVSPIILSIPHGGTFIPDVFKKNLVIKADELWSDWYTSELYSGIHNLNLTILRTELSRFVADVNRDPIKPLFAPFWEGIIASETPFDEKVYSRKLSKEELQSRMALAYVPYHEALNELVNEALSIYGKVLVIDLHSFGMDESVDVIIGNAKGKSASEDTTSIIEAALHDNKFATRRNTPFSGGWIVRQFADNENVDAIQLELNQRTYISSADVNNAKPLPKIDRILFASTQLRLQKVFEKIIMDYIY